MPNDGRTPRARRLAARGTTPDVNPLLAAGVPARYLDELAAAGVHTLDQLRAVDDLTTIRGIGPKARDEILAAIGAASPPEV
jgi:predicted flap endonuclease-1-like 5' DNA nuclease